MGKRTTEREIPDNLFWDASFLIAYVAPRDQYHQRALKIREYLLQKPIKLYTSWPNVSEASTLLLYHYGYSHALALFQALRAFELIVPTRDEYERAVVLFEKLNKDQNLSFNDVLTYLITQERLKKMALLTFDKDFSKVGLTVFIP